MALQFGITGDGSSYGLLQSVNLASSVETAIARDASGKVSKEQAYTRKQVDKYEFLLNGGTSIRAGQIVSCSDGNDGIIKEEQVTKSNTDWQKGSFTVEHSDSSTVTAYS